MAFSQVEIVSSSPFGCVLKDRNRRVRCRETNERAAAFEKNLKELVSGRDHFHNCITVSTDEDDENWKKHSHKNVDYWVLKEQASNGNAKEQGNSNDNKSNEKNYRAGDDGDNGNGCLVMSSRQSRILDKWEARQARETELMASSASASASSSSSSSSNPRKESLRNMQNPQAESDSGAVGNRGASSLVQMWEKRLNRSNSLNNSMNPVSISSRTSAGIGNNDSEASRESEMGDFVHERDGDRSNNEDSLADWGPQSCKTAQSEPQTRRNSDAVESERVRISDIIKRLSSASDDTNDHDAGTSHCESPSRERRHSPVTDQAEQREQQRENIIFSRVICSPKIRGRQAFTDLLMQLERKRHRELDSLGQRQAVSRFTHRGRIQAMLRLRFLRRGIAIRDQQSSQSVGLRSFNHSSHRSAIRHLREKFSPGAEHGATAQNATTSRNPHPEMDNNTVHLEDSSTASGLREDNHLQKASTGGRESTASKEKSVSQTIEYHQKEGGPKIDVTQKGISMETTSDHQKEASPKDDATQKGTNMETRFLDLQGTAETLTYLNGRKGKSSEIAEDHERKQEQHIHGKSQEKSKPTASLGGQNANEMADEQEANEQQQLCVDSQENAETTASLNDWDENELAEEEEEAYFQDQFLETNYDWISEISRPRSYWEDRRKTWYQEMLNSSSEKEEIRQLLERRRVSTFLTSDFRETMDQLMTSHVERQTELEAYQEEEEDEMSQERIGQLLLAHLQRRVHSAASQEGEQAEERGLMEQVNEPIVVEEEEEQEPEQQQEDEEQEEEEDEEEEEEEEEEIPISPLFHEASDFDQSSPSVLLTSPSTIQTWSYQDVGDETDPVRSRSSPQPLPSQAYYQDSWQSSSSTNRISIERELIYDLRAQIEQLHREMSELRKSVHSCMEMKVKLHQSNQQEVHPVKGKEGNNSLDRALKKRSCCICYEMQVDSLLYRCGHMCTCLQCAHELQWSTGKCPICRAPIDDVVRAFMDS